LFAFDIMFVRSTVIPVGAGDALSVVEGFAKICDKNEKSRKPALPKISFCSNVNKRIFRGGGRVYRTCLQALRLLANPPLRLIENGTRSQIDYSLFTVNPLLPCTRRTIINSLGTVGAKPISVTTFPASRTSGGLVSASHFT
jgi:hypothetical protein